MMLLRVDPLAARRARMTSSIRLNGVPTITMASTSKLLFNISEWVHTKSQDALIQILSSGPIPRHVGFVMDGNRRYARQKHRAVQEGHAEGYVALRRVCHLTRHPKVRLAHLFYLQILEICMRLGVRCVSVYAFAIENFKRSPEEVNALMDLAETKLIELCQHGYVPMIYTLRLY